MSESSCATSQYVLEIAHFMQMVSSREAHHVVLYVAVVLLVVLFMLVYRSYVQCGSKSAAMCTDHTNNEALDPHDLASGHCKGLQMEVNPNSDQIRGFYSARQCCVWSELDMCYVAWPTAISRVVDTVAKYCHGDYRSSSQSFFRGHCHRVSVMGMVNPLIDHNI